MPVTFRTNGLSLGRKIQRLQTEGKLVARAAVASKVRDLIEEGFVLAREPRGRPWEPRTRDYSWPILSRTEHMRKSFHVDASGANLIISNDASERGRNYPIFHQFGWRTRGGTRAPARQVMPIKAMPPRWVREIDAVVRVALERL